MASNTIALDIPQGELRGAERTSELGDSYYAFLRIPYAKPPVGELRFQSPQPADGWSGVRDATNIGTICPTLSYLTYQYDENASEDSLFINVYSKEKPQSGRNRPVLVWIHGGGFTRGSGNDDFYGPDYFMAHDVVLVTFNYRLGVLGFLSLQTPECPGNYGLKDQRLALKWVKDNIAYFGGNPNNVTIFGESAGGASVDCHVLSPSSKGLFHKAIAQSGSAINYWAQAPRARECAFLLGKRLGCDTTDEKVLLDFLKKAPAKDLIEKGEKILPEIQGVGPAEDKISFAFVPTVEPVSEDSFFSKHPLVLLDEGDYNDVPYMAGICSDEMIFGLKGSNDYPRWTEDAEFQALIPRELALEKDTKRSLNVAKKIREFYFNNGINIQKYVDVLTANFFAYGTYKSIKHHVTNGKVKSPSYLYRFSYEGTRGFVKALFGVQDIKGTCHGEELSYLFKQLFVPVRLEPGTTDYAVATSLVQMWVNFATNGVPTSDAMKVTWSPVDGEKMPYLAIGEKLEMKENFLGEEMRFWDDIFEMAQK